MLIAQRLSSNTMDTKNSFKFDTKLHQLTSSEISVMSTAPLGSSLIFSPSGSHFGEVSSSSCSSASSSNTLL